MKAMNAMKAAASKSSRRLIVLIALGAGIVVIIAALVLMLVVRDFVRQAIVVPLSYIAWLAGLVLNSFPQSTYWAILLAAGILVAWKSLGSPRRWFLQRNATPIIAESPQLSLLAARQAQLAQINESAFAREKTANDLRELMVQVLAYQERQSSDDIEQRIRNGTLVVPPEIHALLTDWQHWFAAEPVTSWQERLRRLGRRFGLGRQPISSQPSQLSEPSSYERKLARAIAYMETLTGSHTRTLADQPASQLPEES